MATIESERHYFEFFVKNNNINQKIVVLKSINTKQYTLLREIAKDILNEIIPLNTQQFQKLLQYKDFIRKLGSRKLSVYTLVKNIEGVIELLKIVYHPNEVGKQTSSGTNTRLAKNKKISSKEKYTKCSGSRTITSDEDTNSDEEYWEEYFTEEQYYGAVPSEEEFTEEKSYRK